MKYSNEVVELSETLKKSEEISVFDFIKNNDENFDNNFKIAKKMLKSIKKDLHFYKYAYKMINVAKNIVPNPDYLEIMSKDELNEIWNQNIEEIKHQLEVLKKLEKSLSSINKTRDFNCLELIIETLIYISKVRDSIADNYNKDERIFTEEILPEEENFDNSWIVRDTEKTVLKKLVK